MKMRKSMLSASIAAALMFGLSAQAFGATPQPQATSSSQQQDSTTSQSTSSTTKKSGTNQNPQQLQAIQVVGIRAALDNSLNIKRQSNSIVEAVTAEDLGKFPNINAAESLANVPGVSIDRLFGQGERVTINGINSALNVALLDNHPVAQTTWRYAQSPLRGFDFLMIDPDMLGSMEVFKSQQAKLKSGSIGGTIIMHTRKPLDMAANTLAVGLGANYNDQSGRGKPNATLLYSWKNKSDTFGADIALQDYREDISRQGEEVFGYGALSTVAAQNPAIQDQITKGQLSGNAIMPQEVNSARFNQRLHRQSALVNIQWRPNHNFDANLQYLYIRENFLNQNQSVYNFMTAGNSEMAAITSLHEGQPGLITSGTVGQSPLGNGLVYDNDVRPSLITTRGTDLKLRYHNSRFAIGGRIGESKSGNPNTGQYFIETAYQGPYTWGLGPGWVADDTEALKNPSSWTATGSPFGSYNIFNSGQKITYGGLNGSIFLNGPVDQIQFGLWYQNEKTHYTLTEFLTDPNSGCLDAGVASCPNGPFVTLANVGVSGLANGSHGGLKGLADGFGVHPLSSIDQVRDWVTSHGLDTAGAPFGDAVSAFADNSWNFRQRTEAAYAQADFDVGNGLHGNVGLRFVRTKNTGGAFAVPTGTTVTADNVESFAVTQTSTHNIVLPSFNLNYNFSKDVVLRFAMSKVQAWAPVNFMVAQKFLNDTTMQGSGGNPSLGPYKAYTAQASYEWYFAPQAVFAIDGFYDNILTYISQQAVVQPEFNSEFATDPSFYKNTLQGNNGCNASGICDYTMQVPVDAGGAHVRGLTFAYQQAYKDGFGLTSSFTWSTASTSTGQRLPFHSRWVFEVAPYFEKGPFSARVDIDSRAKYTGLGFVAGAPIGVTHQLTYVNASVGWQFTKQLSATLTGQNLTDTKYLQTFDAGTFGGTAGQDVLADEYTTGRLYALTLHYRFSPAPASLPEPAAAPPPPPAPAAPPPPPPPQKVVINLRGVNFKFDRPKPGEHNIGPTLMPPASSSLAILSQAVDTLNRYPQVQVEIDGYTDSVGNRAYNQKLSERRAQIVDDYLTSHGVDASRITAVQGFGAADPVDTNKTAAGRQRNRRVEFKVNGQGIEQGQQ